MHTPLCHHARGEPTELAARAVAVGIPEIGFSEHNPMIRNDWDHWHMEIENLELYLEKIHQAQEDHPQLVIKYGLEVDYIPGHEAWICELADRYPWDYFIGSVHYISDSFDIDNPEKIDLWKERGPYDVWLAYLEKLTQAAASGLFQVIGHADLCKKFCFYPEQDVMPLFCRFLETARDHEVAIEINTAGLRKDCREMYPSSNILGLAADLDVLLTFGSDAHAPEEVGMDFEAAIRLAKSVGYRETCRFTKRQREMVSLP
ncbi:MAG: Histidinol-phosphatase [Verrucomicrobia subdivision 3 bacterium]|nr:Histidinol-phosphatase [Limisphaerales bacterium]MCS1416878.1 Histidinol-phosphatase [Limisphaerales bacterium]